MCVHCEWYTAACRVGLAAMDDATAILTNSPRHTPETRAAFAAGTVSQVVFQGMFQAIRTGNPAALDKVLTLVLEWGKEHLENWPFKGFRVMGDDEKTASGHKFADAPPEVRAAFAGFDAPPGRPTGPDPLAVKWARRETAYCEHAERMFRSLVRQWGDERYADGTFPTGTQADSGKAFKNPDRAAQSKAGPVSPGIPQRVIDAASRAVESMFPGMTVTPLSALPTGPPPAAGPHPGKRKKKKRRRDR